MEKGKIIISEIIEIYKKECFESFQYAKEAFDRGEYDHALMKAYIAGLRAGEIILLKRNYIAKSRKDIIDRFGHLRVMEEKGKKYERMELIEKEDAELAMKTTQWFITLIEKIVQDVI